MKTCSKGKKDKAKSVTRPEDANYDFERNNSRNVLSRCCLNFHDFLTNYEQNCSICSDFLPIKFFKVIL